MLAMEWSDSGIVLSARRHGETSSLVMLFTELHGRHAGLVRGGAAKRLRGNPGKRPLPENEPQPGPRLDTKWPDRAGLSPRAKRHWP